jgi:hypothetical protein
MAHQVLENKELTDVVAGLAVTLLLEALQRYGAVLEL